MSSSLFPSPPSRATPRGHAAPAHTLRWGTGRLAPPEGGAKNYICLDFHITEGEGPPAGGPGQAPASPVPLGGGAGSRPGKPERRGPNRAPSDGSGGPERAPFRGAPPDSRVPLGGGAGASPGEPELMPRGPRSPARRDRGAKLPHSGA